MNGAAPNTVNWILVAYVIAFGALFAAVVAAIRLWNGKGLLPAFGVLLAPWLLVFLDVRIVPVYVSFAFNPEGWGNPVFPVWMTPLVGLGLIGAATVRAVNRREATGPH